MIDSDIESQPQIALTLTLIFLLIVVGGVIDLILDRPTTLLSGHVFFEVLMVTLSLGAAAYLARGWWATRFRLEETTREAARLADEREAWEDRASELLKGLSAEISGQFEVWSLTPTESAVALMLLKGMSHKRIARETGTSERTVRQHSVAIYRKSGLGGRAELAGFFLQALILSGEGVPER